MIMNRDQAEQHALGYAAGREDASRDSRKTVSPHYDDSKGPGFIRFAEAYAHAWQMFNTEKVWMVRNVRDCYETWQHTGGRTIWNVSDYADSLLTALVDHDLPDGAEAARQVLSRRLVASGGVTSRENS